MTRDPRTRKEDRHRVIVGIVAVLVAAVVGYVSYNALSGLPWDDRDEVTVALPDASRLILADDVRIANIRVGQVSSVSSEQGPDGTRYAAVGLKLDRSVGPLPEDSTVVARAASPLGQAYVELTLGTSRTTIPEGGTLSLAQSRPTVAVTDLFGIFDGNARGDFQTAFQSIGDGLAGQGPALNSMFASLAGALPDLRAVASALSDERARLPELVSAFATFAEALGPVHGQLADLVSDGATTFTALDEVREPLGRTIAAAPGAEQAATAAFVDVAPALNKLARASARVEPATRGIRGALVAVDRALGSGTDLFHDLDSLTGPATTTLAELRKIGERPSTDGALRKTEEILRPTQTLLDTILPAQVHCNIFGLMLQNIGSEFALGEGKGPTYATFGLSTLGQPGEQVQNKEPSPGVHINSAPREDGRRCDSNNEPYHQGRQVLRPPAKSGSSTRPTSPPPRVLKRARRAGLFAPDRSGR